MPSRLAALALLALVALAGCTAGPAADTTTPGDPPETTVPTTATSARPTASPTATADAPHTTTRSCYYRSFEVDATGVSPPEMARDLAEPVPEMRYDARHVVRAARSNGTTTVTVLGEPPVADGRLVRANATYYRVERTPVAADLVRATVFELDGPLHEEYDPAAHATAEREAIAFEDLPAADRRAFLAGLPGGERLESLLSGGGSLSAQYDHHYRNASARNASHLVAGEPRYVAYRDTYWRVAHDGDRSGVQRTTVRYELDRTADSAEAFGRLAVERYAVGLNATFEGDQRALLVRAIDRGTVSWSGCGESPPAGYEALFERSRSIAPSAYRFYVSRDGALYRVAVVQMVE